MGTINTLIVDDNPWSLQTTISTLEDAERSYIVAASNAEAWNALEADPTISLVLVRCIGKQIQGTDLCRKIRSFRHVKNSA